MDEKSAHTSNSSILFPLKDSVSKKKNCRPMKQRKCITQATPPGSYSKKWPRFGYALVFACIGGSSCASLILTYQYNLTDGLSRYEFHLDDTRNFLIKIWEHYDMVYKQPYTRICQYLVGLTLGYYLHKKTINKNVVRNCKMTLTCGWVATGSFMWICFFSLHKRKEIMLETAVYNGTKFLLTSCSFAWIIYVCFTGQAEFLNACLSWKALLPLGRLSYCAYLIHPIILFKLLLQTEDVMDFNIMLSISMYLYTFVRTYFISFIASMFYEMPVLSLSDWLGKNCGVKMSRVTFSDCKTNAQNLSDVYKIS
ncbi:hypothetical protein AVEN_43579-1 [Araneus ventricosus]|uniref:Nose resistant to fluoxetine protein 6 n=1 Tax=Araneus ventricosus TaxID=182803 RepID=A0A4Y2EI77_ARAVE|nr:hypothetical protein AVEN_43579-1 [Araneus ventricosus]